MSDEEVFEISGKDNEYIIHVVSQRPDGTHWEVTDYLGAKQLLDGERGRIGELNKLQRELNNVKRVERFLKKPVGLKALSDYVYELALTMFKVDNPDSVKQQREVVESNIKKYKGQLELMKPCLLSARHYLDKEEDNET